MSQLTDWELLDAFLSQEDRLTHSGMMLSDCFSPNQFELVFEYGSVMQRSAVRQALIAALRYPRQTLVRRFRRATRRSKNTWQICCFMQCAPLQLTNVFHVVNVLPLVY